MTEAMDSTARPKPARQHYLILMVSLILLLALQPVLDEGLVGNLCMLALFTATAVGGVYAATGSRRFLMAAVVLACASVLTSWLTLFVQSRVLLIADHATHIVFCTYLAVVILIHVCTVPTVTRDIVKGAICAYLLFGITWAVLYSLIEHAQPGSFAMPALSEEPLREFFLTSGEFTPYLYYSFVTLTTMGYGDITPVSDAARMLSVLEGILGSIYLAVVIAGLVGLRVSRAVAAGKT
ncbi:MAG: two pore domain potassium channel family protein [Phycisphaerales bacterium]|nr:MAG: two pore domain potassium channel family protein [Phycisphaerales bacterium]